MAATCRRLLAAPMALGACLASPPPGGDGPGLPSDAGPDDPRVWVERGGGEPPPQLFGPRLTYDSARGLVLAYGGSTTIEYSGATAAMRAWNGSGWATVCDPCGPGPRLYHGFTFDRARGVAVLYGGVDDGGTLREEHFEWDGSAWTQLPSGGPGARSHFWMAYDQGRERVVVFGGTTMTGDQFDVNEFDGDEWVSISADGAGPSPRHDEVGPAAYDPVGQRVLVYGSSIQDDDLWGWDGATWTRLCESCTGRPRTGAMLEVDPARERILVVGGFDPKVDFGGTWQLLPDGSPACTSPEPTPRDNAGIARDPSRDVIVLFGGNGTGCGGNCNQTLELTSGDGAACTPP